MNDQPPPERTRPSPRSLIGIIGFILGLTLYALLASVLSDLVAPFGLVAEVFYYALAGTLWIFPALRLIRWMNAGYSPHA